jgi:hypothetical protein
MLATQLDHQVITLLVVNFLPRPGGLRIVIHAEISVPSPLQTGGGLGLCFWPIIEPIHLPKLI